MGKFPDQSKRIAALVRDLESGQRRSSVVNPAGSLSISTSPVVEGSVKEGLPAVEPLLDCLVNDRRLTGRSVTIATFSRRGTSLRSARLHSLLCRTSFMSIISAH